MPSGLVTRFAYSKDSDSGQANDKAKGGSSGIAGAGWDMTLEATSDLHGMDGLVVYGGISQVDQYQNDASVDGDRDEKVLGIKYTAGSFSVGYQQSEEDTGKTGTTGYDNTAYGVTFSVNDDLSIGYSHYESEQHNTTNVTEEATSYQIAYTMGGASIRLAESQGDNIGYSTGATADRDATTLSVSLAF